MRQEMAALPRPRAQSQRVDPARRSAITRGSGKERSQLGKDRRFYAPRAVCNRCKEQVRDTFTHFEDVLAESSVNVDIPFSNGTELTPQRRVVPPYAQP
jgi:hypothetical protein